MYDIEIREMIESIVREVVGEMNSEKKEKNGKVLFVFCDSTAHESFKDHFIELDNAKIGYDSLFLDGETSSWLGMNQVESFGSGKIIASDSNSPAPIELPKEYDGVVIPEIDLDNAGRVVSGLKGSVKSEIIFSALVLNKFVLIGDDSPGIKRADRRCLNTLELTKAYKRLFKSYVRQMKDMGLEFVPMRDLAQIVGQKLLVNSRLPEVADDDRRLSTNQESKNENSIVFQKRLLTANWISSQGNLRNETIFLSKNAIISPLAKDLMKERNLTVKRID